MKLAPLAIIEGCYVMGCRERTVLCTIHKTSGLVATCTGHDPHLHGYGRPLCPQTPVEDPGAQPSDTPTPPPNPNALIVEVLRNALQLLLGPTGPQEPDGGKKAKLRRPTPILPPSGATARPF